jgi:hypothetical protein
MCNGGDVPELVVHFTLRGNRGTVHVRLDPNTDPLALGCGVLDSSVSAAAASEYPVCRAEVQYAPQGYLAAMGWVQLVRSTNGEVARRVVVFTHDSSEIASLRRFWLTRDYLPEVADLLVGRPSLTEQARAVDARVEPVLIPWDCADGFFEAYWRRPEADLDDHVRRGMSVWTKVGPAAVVTEAAQRPLPLACRTGPCKPVRGTCTEFCGLKR